jgi:acyl carrier protein
MTLNEMFAKALRDKPENISDATSRDNHRRWDSFTHVQLMVMIEGAYKVKFSNAEIERVRSVAQLKSVLAEKGVEAS